MLRLCILLFLLLFLLGCQKIEPSVNHFSIENVTMKPEYKVNDKITLSSGVFNSFKTNINITYLGYLVDYKIKKNEEIIIDSGFAQFLLNESNVLNSQQLTINEDAFIIVTSPGFPPRKSR